jgi:23S rRNA pseudouridine1911/1915/1917 synthase
MHEMKPTDPTVAAMVRAQTGVTWSRARELCMLGRVSVNGERCTDPAARCPPDAVVSIDRQGPALKQGALAATAILFVDRDVVVVDKPAGMLSVADEPNGRDSIDLHLRTLLRRQGAGDAKLGVVHRLDRDTSGVMVFARSPLAQRALATQFRAHDLERTYVAIAHGEVHAARIETHLVPDRGDGLRGSYGRFRRAAGPLPAVAREAITHVRPLEALAGATLVECRLETGRQHQIRIHLAEAGHPLVGEAVYIRDFSGTKIAAPRAMLHAATLGFVHPRTGKPVRFEREVPVDFEALLAALRSR